MYTFGSLLRAVAWTIAISLIANLIIVKMHLQEKLNARFM